MTRWSCSPGLSGSGKSSLAFDTIYAEGQRRYVESLSAYARQFLEMMQKPDVDHIDGLSPAISIEQKTTSKNPRSTVGTVTEIYDYLRLLFARVGVPYSPATGLPIESQTVSQMVDRVMALPEGTRLLLLAPVVRGRKGEYRKELAEWQKKGYQRVKINGEVYEIGDAPKLDKKFKHDIDVVVDRIVVKKDLGTRLADSFEQALKLADGLAITEYVDKPLSKTDTEGANKSKNDTHERIVFSARFACPVSGFTIDEIEPRLFSFNAPAGACPTCDGLGSELRFEPDLVVPDGSLSLADGAVFPWAKSGTTSPYYEQTLESLTKFYKVSMKTPWEKLPKHVQLALLYGSGDEDMTFTYWDGARNYTTEKPFEGVIGNIQRRWKETDSDWVREELSRYQAAHPCDACGGYRLKPQSLAVKIGGEAHRRSRRSLDQGGEYLVRRSAEDLHQTTNRNRDAHFEGNPRPLEIPQRRRPRIPHTLARLRHIERRREPAHPLGFANRFGSDGRAVRARRALDRVASARQRAAS